MVKAICSLLVKKFKFMEKLNSSNEWGKLKEIIVGKVPNNYIIPTTKKTPFTKSDIKLIKKCSANVFPKKMIKKSQAEIENLCDILKKIWFKSTETVSRPCR